MGHDADHADVGADFHGAVKGPHLVGGQVEELVEVLGPHVGGLDFAFNGFLGEEHIDFRLICFVDGRGAVVHLEQDVRAGGYSAANARRILDGHGARYPPPKEVALCSEPKASEAFVARVWILGVEARRCSGHVQAEDGVVRDVSVAGSDFKRSDRKVIVGIGRKHKHLVLVGHVTAVRVRLRHRQHHVGRSDLAPFRKRGKAWIVGWVTFGFACRHPRTQGRFLVVGKHALAYEVRVGIVWRPRRHVARGRDVLYELSISCHFCVIRQRHGADFPDPMALGAMGVDDGCDVGVESHVLGEGSCWKNSQQTEKQ